MKEYAYYNGIFTPYDACCIPISDRSIFFGDAVYDVVIGRNGVPYQLDAHIERLMKNARRIGLVNMPKNDELKAVASEIIGLSESDIFTLYMQLSGNGARRSHTRSTGEVNVLMTVTEAEIPRELGYVSAITKADERHGYCDVKTTNLFPAVLSVADAELQGADTAIFHKGGLVTECSAANISILKNGELITHPLDNTILPGISQENMKRTCGNIGVKVTVRTFTAEEMLSADAVLVTSTTKLVKICNRIDGRDLVCRDFDTVLKIFDAMLYDLSRETV